MLPLISIIFHTFTHFPTLIYSERIQTPQNYIKNPLYTRVSEWYNGHMSKTWDKFDYVQGKKHPNDKILLFNGIAVEFRDVAMMCLFFMENEDVLYPPPRFQGGEMFADYIREVLKKRKIPSQDKYQIKKR